MFGSLGGMGLLGQDYESRVRCMQIFLCLQWVRISLQDNYSFYGTIVVTDWLITVLLQ